MPRTGNGNEFFQYLTGVKALRIATGTFGDTTTSAALAGGGTDSTVEVAASTNFTAADKCFIIGSGGTEIVTIGTPATTMPFTIKPVFAHDSGARLVEAVESDFGHIEESGVNFGGSLTLTAVNSAISRTPVFYSSQPGELTGSFALLGYNNQNIAAACGATESETGAGTEADPYTFGVGQTTLGSQGTQTFVFEGTTKGGDIVEVYLNDAQVEVNFQVNMGASTWGGIPLAFKYTSLVSRIWTPS